MRFFNTLFLAVSLAFQALLNNKLRAILTTTCIVIGIWAVTTMQSLINGLEKGFQDSIDVLGTNVIMIQKWPWGMGTGTYKWWEYRNRKEMHPRYTESIKKLSQYAHHVSTDVSTRDNAKYKGEQLSSINITGISYDYYLTSSIDIENGRYFSSSEIENAKTKILIGAEVVKNLFKVENPIGKWIRIKGYPFQVIGTIKKAGDTVGIFGDIDNQIIMPISTYKKLYGWKRNINIIVKFANAESKNLGQEEIEGIMRRIRRLDATEKNDFAINKPEAFKARIDGFINVINLIGIGLTGLALFVGGIGVMNIMFVSVKERTKEIGIRKAVGAKRGDIMLQFLLEAVVICCIGGSFGFILSILTSWGISAVIGIESVIYFNTILAAFGICSAIGLLFGFIPSWQASSSDPVESLRYE